jgi:hypothetical protein
MFSFTSLPSHVYLLMFTFSCLPSRVYLLMFTFSCFPSHVFLHKFTFSCLPSRVYLLVFIFSCLPSHVYDQQVFLDKFPLRNFVVHVQGMLLNIYLKSRPPFVCQNHRNISCTLVMFSVGGHTHEQIFLVQKLE